MIALLEDAPGFPAWTIALAIASVSVAVVTAAHVVLHKNEPRSALLWIGLVFLTPLLGSILYVSFGINSVSLRARRIRGRAPPVHVAPSGDEVEVGALIEKLPVDCAHLAVLTTVADRVSARRLLGGNTIHPITDTEAVRDAMLASIADARRSITLASYLFRPDRTGRQFVEELVAAVGRGVEVRVLVGEVLAFSRQQVPRLLRQRGVRAERFRVRSGGLITGTFNMLNHRKLCVVDGAVGYTGGFNIHDGCRRDAAARSRVLDTHFRIEGPVVAHLQEVFVQDWHFTTSEVLSGETWFPRLESRGQVLARGVDDGPDSDHRKLASVLLGALSIAQRSVMIVTPYFLPDLGLIGALNIAAMRGVQIDIVVPERTNVALVRWSMPQVFRQIVESGCRVWLVPPPFDHSKLMVVDSCWSLIGSPNWDTRSLRLNFEFALFCHDVDLSRALESMASARIATARQVTALDLDARGLGTRILHGAARLSAPMI